MGNISDIYGSGFDTNRDDAATGFEPMPPGWYSAAVVNAEVKDTKAQTGKYLDLELDIIGEHYAGRKVWPKITLINPNEMAVEIGMRELAALGQACGLNAITDTDELLGKQIEVKLKIRKEDGHEPDNEVSAYRPLGAGQQQQASVPKPQPTQTNTAPVQQQAPAVSSAPKRPWER